MQIHVIKSPNGHNIHIDAIGRKTVIKSIRNYSPDLVYVGGKSFIKSVNYASVKVPHSLDKKSHFKL